MAFLKKTYFNSAIQSPVKFNEKSVDKPSEDLMNSQSEIIEISDKTTVTSVAFDAITEDSIFEDDMASKSGTRKTSISLDSPQKKKKAQ